MRVSGFTFVRNAIRFDYPVVESIRSVLPIVDELIVNIGDCSDDTPRLIESIGSHKINIVRSRWDPEVRSGGRMLAIQADIAHSHCTGDWAIYIQADEVIHEDDLPKIRAALSNHMENNRVEGLLFEFVHFYGNYHTLGVGRKWYGHEIRAVRPGLGIRAWKDAQGFRLNGRKLRVVDSGAKVYHYGWVKEPARMKAKTIEMARWWHDDRTVEKRYMSGAREFIFDTGGRLAPFCGSHPSVMADRIAVALADGTGPQVVRGRVSLRHKLIEWINERFGWQPGQYRNYSLLPEGDAAHLSPQNRNKDGEL